MAAPVPKPMVELGGQTLLSRVTACLQGRVDPILLSAPDDPIFESLGMMVVKDRLPDFAGPLAGLDAAQAWLATHRSDCGGLVSVPADTPFLPADLVDVLCAGSPFRPRVASFEGDLQPTVTYWPLSVLARLPDFLQENQKRSIKAFLETADAEAVEFPRAKDAPDGDPFFNVNTPEDLALAAEFSGL
ncbi:molybdenum cofactor guanylyltransferase [Consotaella salsifontis]|uniref:Molybdenum cofactor guanylyltransferase n=2 Tax=Consotaella salsifontis TaxID=1365950 RepID=A0A1T4LC14_9HYPH|nr:molybdenum cofactor guanylyltransferase [Consotaella salsifontis]